MVEELISQQQKDDEQILIDSIHANHEKQNIEYKISVQKSKMNVLIKENKKKRLNLFKDITITILGIVVLTCLIFLVDKEGDRFIDDCLNAGNNKYICEKGR